MRPSVNYSVAVLLFHGCGGDPAQQTHWAAQLQGWGFATVQVDSFKGRGIGLDQALAKVCSGRTLLGSERAADMQVALRWVQQQPMSATRSISSGHEPIAGEQHCPTD